MQRDFVAKLDYQMQTKGVTAAALAERLAVSAPAVYGWKNNGRFDREHAIGLSQMFGTSVAYWLSPEIPFDDPADLSALASSDAETLDVPFLGDRLNYGTTLPHIDRPLRQLRLSRSWLSARLPTNANLLAVGFVYIEGAFMGPTFHQGDIAFVQSDVKEVNADGLYLIRQGDQVDLRYAQRLPGGALRLSTESPKAPPVEVPVQDLDDFVQVVAKVPFTWALRNA
jgi:plasmid maintenance system antidote protein VapI